MKKEDEIKKNVIEEEFACNVLTNDKLAKLLSKSTFEKYMKTVLNGDVLEIEVADEIAGVMKNWAIERGATHYAHWFQPLTGKTAAKYDSFLEIDRDGNVITDLLGTELIKGETDASSFPSGGLRATFEARGYTIWDVTSPVFVKENALYIPTIYYSYNDDVLDKKTPLLRSEEILSNYAIKVLRLLGNTESNRVISNVGAEQEYFLVDKDLYLKRRDLMFTGRTLLGNLPAKDQTRDQHYFGYIKSRVARYMKELDIELWKLGIPAKTKHNEAAPAQHELAPLYTEVNVACDNNQLMMEVMRKVAKRENFVCLLHEKPFCGINGSGKHNNWSLCTDDGINLFRPGSDPANNIEFLLFMSAVIMGVDKHADLLRVSTITSGNDLRLGGNEAPPAILSIFLGEKYEEIFNAIASDKPLEKAESPRMNIGVKGHQNFMKDSQDRNRTSPFAFTGNKFEFRMLPSSINLYTANTIMHVIMIDSLSYIIERLENSDDKKKEAMNIVRDIINEHKRILFNGDNYSKEWEKEAKARGLLNIKDSADALSLFKEDNNVELFTKYNILTKEELLSQIEVIRKDYIGDVLVEARVLIEMIDKEVLPVVNEYIKELVSINTSVKEYSKTLKLNKVDDDIKVLVDLDNKLYDEISSLKSLIGDSEKNTRMHFYSKDVRLKMSDVRKVADELETIIPKDKWPFPTYEDLLYRI